MSASMIKNICVATVHARSAKDMDQSAALSLFPARFLMESAASVIMPSNCAGKTVTARVFTASIICVPSVHVAHASLRRKSNRKRAPDCYFSPSTRRIITPL